MPQLDPTTNFTGPFRFFDLPRELRDMVYHELWAHTPCLSRYVPSYSQQWQIGISASYKYKTAEWDDGESLRGWFCASKCFLAEAMKQFYRGCELSAVVPDSNLNTNIWFGSLEYDDEHRENADYDLIFDVGSRKCYSKNAIAVDKSQPTNMAVLKKMENALVGSNGCKTLHIAFAVVLTRVEEELEVDLSAFESTGFRLDKLVVDVIGIETNRLIDRADKLLPVLKAELARLGGVLVGQKSLVKFSINYDCELWHGKYWRFEITKG